MRLLPLLLLLLSPVAAAATAAVDCVPALPLPLTVRIDGATAPQQVLLVGGGTPGLRILDAQTGATLWSAGAVAPVSQRFAAMTAAFAGSFTALDTDHDGLHDRLYAGDLAGRLWRFDLHNGAPAGAWASGGVFADFSNDAGRGFRAPADVSLANAPGMAPWLNIALGTAAPGHVAADNRFYVLRDYAPFESWGDARYRDWTPLREAGLLRVTTATTPEEAITGGWFIELGSGEVITASLTVSGRTVLAVAETTTTAVTGCRSAFSVGTLDLAAARPLRDAHGDWRRALPGDIASDAAFTLAMDATGTSTTARCALGDARAAECDVDTRPRRTWWRRGDAE